MPDTTSGVYRCPSCGSLAQVDFAEDGQNVCPECGFKFRRPVRVAPRATGGRLPSAGKFVQRNVVSRRRLADQDRVVTPAAPTDIDVITIDEENPDVEIVSDDGHRRVVRRRKKKRRARLAPVLFLGAWLLAAMLIVVFVRSRLDRESVPVLDETDLQTRRQKQKMQAEIDKYVRAQVHEHCRKVLSRFFGAGTAAGRAQAVRDPLRVTPLMADHYRRNPPWRPSGVLQPILQNLYLDLDGDKRAIETVWRDPEGEELEVVFIQQEGEWRIDWEAFVRYSTEEWLLFVNGNPQEGEFRLYMRPLKSAQVGGEQPKTINLKFYPPSYDQRLRNRGESDTVVVPTDSEVGRQLEELFAMREREREPEPTESQLAYRDPEDLYRVRVKLVWRPGPSGKDYLRLEEIVAPNWYGKGFEEVGLTPRADEDADGDDAPAEEEPEPENPDGGNHAGPLVEAARD